MVLLSVVERGGGGEGVVAIQDMKPTVLISPWHTISIYFIHLSKRQTSSISYMPGAILNAGNMTVKRTDKKPSLRDLAIQTSARDSQGEVLWGQERGLTKGAQTASPFICSQHPWHGISQDVDARTLPVSSTPVWSSGLLCDYIPLLVKLMFSNLPFQGRHPSSLLFCHLCPVYVVSTSLPQSRTRIPVIKYT